MKFIFILSLVILCQSSKNSEFSSFYSNNLQNNTYFINESTNKKQESIHISSVSYGNDLTFTFENDTLKISGTGDMFEYSTNNPAPWNENLSSITDIIINDGVTSVGSYTFTNCVFVESISISSTASVIGSDTFYDSGI